MPILSASPASPVPPLEEIPVRPLMAPQKFFLHVRNPSDRPRVVKIQVLADGAAVPGGTAEVSIGPRKTERVTNFGDRRAARPPAAAAIPPGGASADKPGQPANPAAGLTELAASATISLRLSFDGKPPIETTFPVRLAGPADYIAADVRRSSRRRGSGRQERAERPGEGPRGGARSPLRDPSRRLASGHPRAPGRPRAGRGPDRGGEQAGRGEAGLRQRPPPGRRRRVPTASSTSMSTTSTAR